MTISRVDYLASPEASLEAIKNLPGIQPVLQAAINASIEVDEKCAAELEAERDRLAIVIRDIDASAAAAQTVADERVYALQSQLAAARDEAQQLLGKHLSERAALVEARHRAHRGAYVLRERIAKAKGERQPLTEQQLAAIKPPVVAPLFDPRRPRPAPSVGFVQAWQR